MINKLPTHFFPNTRAAAWFWFILSLIMFIMIAIHPVIIIRLCMAKKFYIDINNPKTVHVEPLHNYDDLRKNYLKHAKRAATALLSVNPCGYDFPDLVKTCFTKDFLAKNDYQMEKFLKEFRENNIFQKVGIQSASILSKEGGNLISIQVDGQLIRVGIKNKKAKVYKGKNFNVKFWLKRNTNLLKNRDIKYQVYQYDLTTWDIR